MEGPIEQMSRQVLGLTRCACAFMAVVVCASLRSRMLAFCISEVLRLGRAKVYNAHRPQCGNLQVPALHASDSGAPPRGSSSACPFKPPLVKRLNPCFT
eukprot:11805651-Alexandrium_andersonii.AAC.1